MIRLVGGPVLWRRSRQHCNSGWCLLRVRKLRLARRTLQRRAQGRCVPSPSRRGPQQQTWWRSKLSWRTFALLAVLVLFPRVVALAVTLTLRLVAKAAMHVVWYLFKEMWYQVLLASHEIEDAMVQWLSEQLGYAGPAPIPNFYSTPTSPPASLPAGSNSNEFRPGTTQTALPTRPWDFLTLVLVVLQVRQQLAGGGGIGGPRQ